MRSKKEIETLRLFDPLYSRIETITDSQKPLLLAHYTSVQVVEQILKNNEIWFSNPLYMNDIGEMRSGINLGFQIYQEFVKNLCLTGESKNTLIEYYTYFDKFYREKELFNTYIFCLTEHTHGDNDGRLSMWREYGSKGHGAAIVINTQLIDYHPHNPLH